MTSTTTIHPPLCQPGEGAYWDTNWLAWNACHGWLTDANPFQGSWPLGLPMLTTVDRAGRDSRSPVLHASSLAVVLSTILAETTP